MELNLEKLKYKFTSKPLLIGGKAKEYYEIRKSGVDTDLVVTENDYLALSKMYPENLRDIFGDLGVCPLDFEIWKTIRGLNYDFLSEKAI
ncbi:MAG: hypothetical protein WCO84_04570, partial [bacterium]